MTDGTPNNQEPLFEIGSEDSSVTPEENTAEVPEDGTSESPEQIQEDISSSKRKIFLSLGVLGAMLLGGAGAYGYEQFSQNNQAQGQLQEAIDARTDIAAVNTDVMEYSGSEGGYALGVGGAGNYPASGAFVFGSEQGEYNRVVDVYIDYSNTRSRDFFFANNAMLRGLIESSEVQVRIHAVPSDHPYSVYAAETMAHAFHKHPDRAWEVHISLLQISEDILGMEEPSRADMIGAIESELERFHDITDIDQDLILEGMFTDWLASTGSDSRLQAGAYPPLVYSNGNLVNTDSYYTPDELRGNILSPSESSFTDDELSETDIDSEEDLGASEGEQENSAEEGNSEEDQP